MKIRTPVILTIISLFFLLPLRWFNVLEKFGENVSFSVSDGLFAAVLIAVLLIVVFCSITARGARIRVNTKKSALMGFIMLLAAIVLVWEAVVAYTSYSVTATNAYNSFANFTLSDYQIMFNEKLGFEVPKPMLLSAVMFSGKAGIVYCVSCILGAVGFLLMSYDFFGGKNFFRTKPLLAILPTIWGVVRIACSYMYYTTVADLSPCVFDILFSCSTLVFLFAQARLFSDLNAYNSVKIATASGLCSVLFFACSNGIRYAMMATGREAFLTDIDTANMSDSIITVMIAAYIIYIIAPRAHRPVKEEDVDKIACIEIPIDKPVRNTPNLYIHSEQPSSRGDSQNFSTNSAVQDINEDDYYYGDFDSNGRRIVLPANMNARGTLPTNTYRLKKASPLAPNVRINTRLRDYD